MPVDPSKLAKAIIDEATNGPLSEEDQEELKEREKLSESKRVGGRKGGEARAAKLTPEQREDIARTAAHARWKK